MPRTLGKSVGNGGFNREQDVLAVQDLLNLVPPGQGGPTSFINVDGLAFGQTQDAIKKFQRVALRIAVPDGRVDPGGRTLRALNTFEKNGSKSFVIARFELSSSSARLADAGDRFYSISASGSARRIVYFFLEGGGRLARPQQVLPRLQGRIGEGTTFQTKLVHSPLGFQAASALHSEKAIDKDTDSIALSLVIPGDTMNIFLTHKFIKESKQPGVVVSVRGNFRPIGETTGIG
jgi:hypothetical protein